MEQQHQLEVFYQPQACLASGKIIGMEALVRWRHPTRGMIAPVDFIPLAEETGLINPLGDWVLRTALRPAATIHLRRPAADAGGGQPVGAPAAAKGFHRLGRSRAGRHRPAAAPAGAGDHREQR